MNIEAFDVTVKLIVIIFEVLEEPITEIIMSTPLGGGYIIFAFSAVRCPASDVRRHAWFPPI